MNFKKDWIHWIWIVLFSAIIVNHFWITIFTTREGMENSSCDQVSSQKNAGNIAYLQETVSKLQQMMNSLQVKDNQQQASLNTLEGDVSTLKTDVEKNTKLSKQNETTVTQMQTEIQDRIKAHQKKMQDVLKQ